MKTFLLKLRRLLLSTFIPEFYWPLSVNINGAEIAIRNQPFSFGTKWILKKKEYENAEIELVNQVLKGGEHVLEMGTSIGVLTRVMSKLVGASGKIITVECNESLYKSCFNWNKEYHNVQLLKGYGFPVYKVPDNLSIDGYSDDLGSLGTKIDFSVKSEQLQNDEQIIDIHSVEEKYNFHPSVLVIDVEGSEEIILEKVFTLPTYIKTIIIELHGGMYKNKIQSQEEIISAIKQDGFMLTKVVAASYLFERP